MIEPGFKVGFAPIHLDSIGIFDSGVVKLILHPESIDPIINVMLNANTSVNLFSRFLSWATDKNGQYLLFF